jgi:sugar phosphate isomerase/epimerase
MINRRQALFSIAGSLLTSVLGAPAQALRSASSGRKRLGIDTFSYNIRLRADRQLRDPLNFLEHCHQIGAGGVQMGIGVRDEAYIRKLRSNAEKYEMFIEGSEGLPRNQSDIERFEKVVRTAKHAGVKVIRVAMGGRRYEQFDRAEQFKAFADRSWKSLQLAEPVAAKHRIRLAIENHKDWLIPDMLSILERISSEYVGVCVDTGNSFALLENPMVVVRSYAPWAFAVHLKDMAVCEYEDGFLLADVLLGEGLLDLPGMVRTLRKTRPEIQFGLEMATRDPLKVPCLTEKYWTTFAEVPGSDLARTLRYVRANAAPKKSLPHVSHLPLDEQTKREEDNVRKSLAFARDHLSL